MRLAPGFKKITPKKPVVVRKGDVVQICYFYQGMKECLGALCYWQRVGRCPIYEKLQKQRAK
jgi:hypothetical protein